jgi:CRP-like cAMP-binding protein
MTSTAADVDAILRVTSVFSSLSAADRRSIAEAGVIRSYPQGAVIFEQDAPADTFYTVTSGLVKVYRLLPTGKQLTLQIFGAGAPIGALAVYDGLPFPATAGALAATTCLLIPRDVFFRLLEEHPSVVRGLLHGLSGRVMELLNRLTELSGRRIEPRFARLFLKLTDELGRPERGGMFVPIMLSRQELADLTGTRIETCIRIMSRWGKQGLVRTEKDGFVLLDRARVEEAAIE